MMAFSNNAEVFQTGYASESIPIRDSFQFIFVQFILPDNLRCDYVVELKRDTCIVTYRMFGGTKPVLAMSLRSNKSSVALVVK